MPSIPFFMRTKTSAAVVTGDLGTREILYDQVSGCIVLKDNTNVLRYFYPITQGATPLTSADKGIANGVAGLDAGGKIPSSLLPAVAIGERFPAANQTARLALTAQIGDTCLQADNSTLYLLTDNPASVNANWVPITNNQAVTAINGMTGNVTLTTDNISEGSTNKYYTDARVSTWVNTQKGANNGLVGLNANGAIDCGTF